MIAILTALEVEHAAVRAHLVNVEPHRHDTGTQFDVGALATHPERRIALAAVGMGNLTAAALTERVSAEFHPTTMMFVGIAGGLREWIELGDVVVATRVYAYHGGRIDGDEFLGRPRAWDLAHVVEQAARPLARSNAWHESLPRAGTASTPVVHFEPIASGEIVHNSTDSAMVRHLRSHYNDAVAVETESAGFTLAGHLRESTPTVTIRAISDHAGGAKEVTDRAGWRAIAARNAAAFAVALAAALDDKDESGVPKGVEGDATPPIHNRNVARDNARVGQQIGINLGNHYGSPAGGQR